MVWWCGGVVVWWCVVCARGMQSDPTLKNPALTRSRTELRSWATIFGIAALYTPQLYASFTDGIARMEVTMVVTLGHAPCRRYSR